jgi:streptogramin lyase
MFDPANEKYKTYAMPNRGVSEDLTVAKDGKIICTLKTSSKIAIFNPVNGEFVEVPVTLGKSKPNGIGIDSEANIWVADTSKNTLFRLDGAMIQKLWSK